MVQLVLKPPSQSGNAQPSDSATPPARLERSVARLKVALGVAIVAALLPWVGIVLLWDRGPNYEQWVKSLPNVVDLPCDVRARAFRACSPNGHEIAFVGRGVEGGGNVTLRDESGGKLLVAGDFDGHGGFVEVGSADHINAHLGAGETPDGFLTLRNEKGSDVAYLGHDPRGDGTLHLNRREGTDLLTVARGEHDESFLSLLGPGGKPNAVLVADDEAGRLDLYDARTRKIVYVGPLEGGSGIVKVFDPNGAILAAFGATGGTPKGGFFEAFDRKGQPIFYGGMDNGRGCGVMNVFDDSARMLVAIGIDADLKGGVLNVFDRAGEMVLRTPDWK